MAADDIWLRRGDKPVSEAVVLEIIDQLEELLRTGTVTINELVKLCADPGHPMWGDTADTLESAGLVVRIEGSTEVRVNYATQCVVDSAVEGAGPLVQLVSPIANW